MGKNELFLIHMDNDDCDQAIEIGEDLFISSREAVMRMIDYLVQNFKIKDTEAYMLCSVAGNLKISEIVDMPNWVVSFQIPKSIFI